MSIFQHSNNNQSVFLPYYKNLLPKPISSSSSSSSSSPHQNDLFITTNSRCQEKQISARVAHKREMMPKKKILLPSTTANPPPPRSDEQQNKKQQRSFNLNPNIKRGSSSTTTNSSSYRQRLERIKTNCQLIRQRRRRYCLFPIRSIQLRPSLFEQRCHQSDALERINIDQHVWQSTNLLRLSDEYLYKCKFAMFSSTNRHFQQNEFFEFLKQLFSYDHQPLEYDRNASIQCHLCEQKFSSQKLFNIHMKRRSISIQYHCLICQLWIKTMNPCSAYYHLLIHNKNLNEKQIEQLTINVDWDQCSQFIDETLTSDCDLS